MGSRAQSLPSSGMPARCMLVISSAATICRPLADTSNQPQASVNEIHAEQLQVEEYLQGSPVAKEVGIRLKARACGPGLLTAC